MICFFLSGFKFADLLERWVLLEDRGRVCVWGGVRGRVTLHYIPFLLYSSIIHIYIHTYTVDLLSGWHISRSFTKYFCKNIAISLSVLFSHVYPRFSSLSFPGVCILILSLNSMVVGSSSTYLKLKLQEQAVVQHPLRVITNDSLRPNSLIIYWLNDRRSNEWIIDWLNDDDWNL
jgi:hypothetical protein